MLKRVRQRWQIVASARRQSRLPQQRRRQLRHCRRGGPALEFALICPVLIVMTMGVYDISQLLLAVRRLSVAAQQVAEAAATFAVSPDALGIITSTQGNQAMSIADSMFRQWLGPQPPPYGVTLTSVDILPTPANCLTNCTYTATTAWSIGLNGGEPVLRACGNLGAVSDTTPTSLTTLPTGLFNPPSILVADVSTLYTPQFLTFLGPIFMMRSAYMPPREMGSADYVRLLINGAVDGRMCPGFP